LCLHLLGENERARAGYEESANGFESLFGARDYRTLHVRNSLAGVLRAMGRPSEAEEIYRQVLPLRLEVQGISPLQVTETRIGLGKR